MKPLNLDNSPCTPTSSNCVIWQGPNIPCIKLCTGDTVSDVVFKLATELCTIMDTLNISNYDIACLNLPCSPDDYQALIQVLINKICELENIPVPPPSPNNGNCPTECVVEVAACLGGGTDFLLNYIKTIADKICDILDEISIIKSDINTIDNTLIDIQNDINIIISNPYTLPTVQLPNGCTIGIYTGPIPDPLPDLSQMFNQFILDWCQFRGVIGSNVALSSAVSSQCIVGTDIALQYQYSLTSPTNFIQTQYPSFNTTPATVADAINNIWIALCDVRDAGKKLSAVAAGTNVTVTSAVTVVGNDEVTTYTVNTELTDIKNEGILLTGNPQSIDFVGDLVNATTVGDDVTVTVDSFGGMLAQGTPPNLSSSSFSALAVDQLCNLPLVVIPEIYDDYNEYNPVTGIWQCATTGRYNLSCFAHYSREEDIVGWYDATLAPNIGMFGVGIFDATTCGYYCANYMTVGGPIRRIDITAQAMGMNIVAGTQLCVRIVNYTGYNYTSFLGDVIRFSVQRIK